MNLILSNLMNGLSYGMILFLIASGMSIVLGMMGITNLAHGALYMVGAYIGWTIFVQLEMNFWLAILVGAIGAGVLGLLIERVFLKHLYKQINEQVLLTYGFVYIITNIVIWIWGGRYRLQFTAPELMGSIKLGDFSFPITRIVITVIGLVVALFLWYLQDKTRIGAIVRAGMDDKEMIQGLGIDLEKVSAAVFFLASCIAGLAGVVGAQLLSTFPGLGSDLLLLMLAVIIVGGIGTIQGSLVGGLLIGLIDTFGKALFPGYAMFTIYFAMVVVLLVKPTGLLGRS
ncbi:MAG: ABC transporter permease [Chloroflexi bacterium RBG_19FT_COMBO_47_9]|nr:MAG: ABC transporter permease [Chloroflexi bacterium RBG_19FT_COMBO_47_9]